MTMRRAIIVLVFLGAAACGPVPTMIMPDHLETTGDVYEVSGANGSFLPTLFDQEISFGPYVASVQIRSERDKVRGPTIRNDGHEVRQSTQRAQFTMRGGKTGVWKGSCTRTARKVIQHAVSHQFGEHKVRTDVEPVVIEDVDRSLCDLRNMEVSGVAVTLDLREAEVIGGSVESRFGVWQLWSSSEQRDQPFAGARAGIVFQDASGGAIAALDTGGHKRIAFMHELQTAERDSIAAISVCILLQNFF
jgi:hypothetical protein